MYSIVITSQRGKYTRSNPMMVRLAWYLKDVLRVPGVTFVCGESYFLDYGRSWASIPIYDVYSSTNNPVVLHDGEKITIKCASEQNKDVQSSTIILSSKKAATIDSFLKKCSADFEDYVKEADSARLKKIRCINSCVDDKWSSTPITIKKTLDNVFMTRENREKLQRDIDEFVRSESMYDRDGIPWKRGYLLYGPPGTGKTSTWYAIAEYTHRDIYRLSLEQVSQKDLKALVRNIPKNTIVVVDDIDRAKVAGAKVTKNNDVSGTETTEKETGAATLIKDAEVTIASLLEIFDGYDHLRGCIVVFTANDITKIEPALIRPGRIDVRFMLDLPNTEVVDSIYQHFYKRNATEQVSPDTLMKCKCSTSEIINTFIAPNRGSYDAAIELLVRALTTCA